MAKNDDFIQELANSFLSGNTKDVVDIITFVEATWGLNFKLFPVQKFILRCFYGYELDTKNKYIKVPDQTNEKILYEFTEAEFLKWLYEEGRCNTDKVTGKQFRELDLVIGRRGSKSILVSLISAYELYKLVKRGDPVKYYNQPHNETISILNVAPADDQAEIIFKKTMGLALSCPFMTNRLINPTQEYFNIQTDADLLKPGGKKYASLQVLSGGCSSNTLRGQNAIVVAMDEMAFFINEGRFSGEAVYKALQPSTGQFRGDGKVIVISSPYAKYGKFYERYQKSFEEPDVTLMFQMYTSMVNPDIDSIFLRTARRASKVNFNAEFGAEFSDSISAWIEDENEFRDGCVRKDIQIVSRGTVGTTYFMALDLGLKNDGTAIAVSHKDEKKNKIILDHVDLFYSGSSDVWEREESLYHKCNKYKDQPIIKVKDIANHIKELVKWFPIKSGFFDQYNGYALMEILHDLNLKQFRMEPVTEALNNDVYQLFKTLYSDSLIEIPEHPIVVPELLSLESERKGKARVVVRAPNKVGSHDDLSDAIVCSIYECFNNYHGKPMNISSAVGKGTGREVVGASDAHDANMTMFQMNKMMKHGLNTQRNPKMIAKTQRGHMRGRM